MDTSFPSNTSTTASFEELRWHLRSTPRDLLFLDLLSLCGLPLSRLVSLRGDAIKEEDGRLYVSIPEDDGAPAVKLPASPEVANSFSLLRENGDWSLDGPLFRSRKGQQQLSLSGASRLVKRWEEFIPAKRSLAVALRKNGKQGVMFAVRPSVRAKKRTAPPILQGELYTKIFNAIVSHELPPGERVAIDSIRERFGASQGPIREALQRLQALGFVVKKGNKLYVTPLSKKDFRDLIEARVLLECKLAEAAVPLISRATVVKLEKMHSDFIAQWDGRREGLFPQYDRQFHLMIYAAADKPAFFQMTEWLWQRSYPYLHLIEHSYILEDSGPAHERMLIGLKKRDPRMVSDAIRDNLLHGLEDLHDYLN